MRWLLVGIFFIIPVSLTNFNDDYYPVVMTIDWEWTNETFVSVNNEYVCNNMWQLFNHPPKAKAECHYWPYDEFNKRHIR